ncbi:MAG: hypothetical protein WB511_04200 [Nitrososphaeraceae archaeon]
MQKYLRAYLAGLPGVKYDTLVVNQTTITQEKIPAVRAEFQAGAGNFNFGKSILYITIKNNTAYIILYNFGDKTFENHLIGFQSMIDTFKLT